METAEEKREEAGLHFLDYWRVIRSRKEIVLAVSILVVLTGAAITFTLPKTYMSEARILVRPDALDVNVFERQIVPSYDPYFLRTQYQVIQSRTILYEVIKNLDLTRVWGKKYREDGQPLTLQEAYTILENSVAVEQYRDTSLISIKVYRDDPQEAARLANEIAYVYRDYRLSVKRKEIKRAIDALKNELEKQRDIVNQVEEEVEQLRKELGVSTIMRGVRLDKLRLQQLEADRIAARVDMLVRKSRLEQLEGLTGEDLMNASAYVVRDDAIAAIRQNLIDTEVSLKLARANYGENHPQVQRLLAGRAELKRQLDAALEGLKKGLRADYEVAKQKYEALDAELRAAKQMDIEAERERF
ncbi:MAG TPA: hypothetical protein ENG36_00665, partial [Lentisphaerae bacterium]|nr:hypothetical protein [Lentisphaerota bacterium]